MEEWQQNDAKTILFLALNNMAKDKTDKKFQ